MTGTDSLIDKLETLDHRWINNDAWIRYVDVTTLIRQHEDCQLKAALEKASPRRLYKGERLTMPKGDEAKRNECDCLRRPDSEGMPTGEKPVSPTTVNKVGQPDEKAFKKAIDLLAEPDKFSSWDLDEGSLRAFVYNYEAVKQASGYSVYAGGQPERLESAPSDAGISTPDRQGEALIAEPPAPACSETTVVEKGTIEHLVKREIPRLLLALAELDDVDDTVEVSQEMIICLEFALVQAREQLKALRLRLRSTEPVSLEDITQKYIMIKYGQDDVGVYLRDKMREQVQDVLDTAGVPYVE